jgi:uncharacterized ion transporter superfamily protein YfcC
MRGTVDRNGGLHNMFRSGWVMMLLIIAAAIVLSWLIPSGLFDRAPNGHVLPGTYYAIPKQLSVQALLLPSGY